MADKKIKPIRIAILLGAPFTEQNFDRVGIPYLSPHFEVRVFDCLNWLGRNADEIKCKRVHWQHVIAISTELDLDEAMRVFKPSYAIDAIGFGAYTAKIQEILAKHDVKFVVPKAGVLPTPSLANRIRNFILRKSEQVRDSYTPSNSENIEMVHQSKTGIFFTKLFGKLKQAIAVRKNISPPDISLLAGDNSFDFYTMRSPKIIWIGSHDFHQFKKTKRDIEANKKIYVEGEFLLFIDDAIPTANDWALLNMKPPVTAAEYYSTLRAFFERVESYYGLPVVIAGHPNSKADEKYPSNIGGRTVIFGETAALACKSTLVLVHGSTAVSFAVLARKPTLFFTTRELDESAYGIHVRTMAKSLGRPLMFMDELNDLTLSLYPLTINENKYRLYETNYLRSERSKEEAPWSAFIDFVGKTSGNDVHLE